MPRSRPSGCASADERPPPGRHSTVRRATAGPRAALLVDGTNVEQAVRGNDIRQTDHDPRSCSSSDTFNVPLAEGAFHDVRFASGP